MRKSSRWPAWQVVCIGLTVLMLLVGYGRLRSGSSERQLLAMIPSWQHRPQAWGHGASAASKKPLNASLVAKAPSYVSAILNPKDTAFKRLECPAFNKKRYAHLQTTAAAHSASSPRRESQQASPPPKTQYFFALSLRQAAPVLPRLLGSIIEVIRFLGPESCVLSIVEGNSNDGTWEILSALRPALAAEGIKYHLQTSPVDPLAGDRIARLADLRNLALAPLTSPTSSSSTTRDPLAPGATVIFLNDVAACPEDILELVHQRRTLEADMVCGMDWTYVGKDPTFYDVWVARTLQGDAFFNIPPDGSWDYAWNLFWNDGPAHESYTTRQPFQVYSCWNGGVALRADAVVGPRAVRFRGPRKTECPQGEPMLFCKDLWTRGMGRIAVVPSVNLEYGDEAARKIKGLKGYVSQAVEFDGSVGKSIAWRDEPPEKVRCWSTYDKQEWRAWDDG